MSAALADELAVIDELPPYLTIAELEAFLRVSERTVWALIERRELARRRLGSRTIVPRASVRAWVLREAGVDADELEGVPIPDIVRPVSRNLT